MLVIAIGISAFETDPRVPVVLLVCVYGGVPGLALGLLLG